MSDLTAKGTIYKIMDTQEVTTRFKKRDFVLEYADNPMYPQYVSFQLAQDKVDLIDPYAEGEQVEVHFNLRGREWISPGGEVRYFNTLEAWRIARLEGSNDPKHYSQTMAPPPPPPKAIDKSELEDDDLPF